MSNAASNLSNKTDLELTAMVRELALQIDAIRQEQTRRSGREIRAAEDAEENEGGGSKAAK